MVLFYTSTVVDPPASIYMGVDKVENEELLKYGFPEDVWFHVDKLVKANSIQGNKKNNITVIYTPFANLKKTGDMAVGAVAFHNDREVRRAYVKEKENGIVNRLEKTRLVKDVDHEAVRQERERALGRQKKEFATAQKQDAADSKRVHKELSDARDYSHLFSEEAIAETQRTQQRRQRLRARAQGVDGERDQEEGAEDEGMSSDDSFM
ncbi:hypothetical protein MSPP1_001709 [Malassezia sp. CBS 17886]|nr:hypothetical protein MSPP1_001709 [Malassezia sp. CBS 17886]